MRQPYCLLHTGLVIAALLGLPPSATAGNSLDPTPPNKSAAFPAEPNPFELRKEEISQVALAGGETRIQEAMLARGMSWLAEQQQANGAWKFDGTSTDTIAATSMAMLPFLGWGISHQSSPGEGSKRYVRNVRAGLVHLIRQQSNDGNFRGASTMYSTALATMALCEAYGLSNDRNLKGRAQAALNYIQAAQGKNGSWGYSAGQDGDTSITGWQIQALRAGKYTNLEIDEKVIERAEAFLQSVSSESESRYGYRFKYGPRPSLTAVGLFCRQFMGWKSDNQSLKLGVNYLIENPPNEEILDMYYVYYATQTFYQVGGDDWNKWKEQVVLLLRNRQRIEAGPDQGSWPKDDTRIGSHCGSIGTTALSLLTLEVYRRYPAQWAIEKAKEEERKQPR